MTFHALAPALVFHVLVTSQVEGGEFLQMVAFYAPGGVRRRCHGIRRGASNAAHRAETSAFLLVVVCSNSGNYGLPVALLAFGREALAYASVYFVASSIFSYTGGVLLAASGERHVLRCLAGRAAGARGVRCRGGRVGARPSTSTSRSRCCARWNC